MQAYIWVSQSYRPLLRLDQMDDSGDRRSQRQLADLVHKTIVESHSFPSGHGFPGFTPFTSILKELRYREMGDRRMRLDKIWPSLMKSENRDFQQSHEFKVRGETSIDCMRAVSSVGVINLEEEVMRGFTHERSQFDGQGVRCFLSADTEALARNNAHIETNDHMKRIMEKYVILLTNMGQIRLYAEEDNNFVLAHRFNLPAHLFNFKSLSWNVERDEIYAVGVSPRRHIDDIEDAQFSHTSRRSNPFSRSYALAVISIHPVVVVKYLVRLDSQMFGQLTSISIHGDTLVCMSSKNSTIYNMHSLCDEYIRTVPTPIDYGNPSSDQVVLFNMIITKKPQPLRIFFGSLYSIDIGCTSMHVILQFNKDRQYCRIESCDEAQPIFVDGWPDYIPSTMAHSQREGGPRFHPDASTKLLRFEGNILKCYNVQSGSNENEMNGEEEIRSRVSLLWSVRLLPHSFNPPRPPSPDIPMDRDRDQLFHTHIIHSIKLVPGNMLMIVMIYNANMAQIEFYPPPHLYCPMAIFLDATTGILVKVTPVDNSIFYVWDSVEMGLGGLFSVGSAEECDTKIVRIFRLIEREPPKEIPNYKSGILNRRQRRLIRRKMEPSGDPSRTPLEHTRLCRREYSE